MLEVKNLRKQYRTKNGVVTNALDDVTLTFPESGMVFILGKSGSGKSTLLNVCGGLDRADSGEIIIKGKSSRDFSGRDFDSYRNTFVGFVFQEYNILDEFTVEDNIALALELQNKKRDKDVIARILEDVEMTSLAQRKPNTLSGGQKQRVAIARALVKEPQIIMADEPTGALDSATGKQVFDTLKKLSRDKLVIVISHDRDFAEQYADRIIELKDGKVISDQVRDKKDESAENVRFYGTDTVCIDDGSALTDDDLQNIKKFLSRSGGTAVISTARGDIAEIKKERPEVQVGGFSELESQPESESYPEQHLIRSHLPARHAIKMGASGLKIKPVRLVFTVLLSVIAFILFGLASTLMLFDARSVTVQSFVDSGYNCISISKAYWVEVKSYYGSELEYEEVIQEKTPYTFDEFYDLKSKYTGALAAIDNNTYIEGLRLSEMLEQFYTTSIDGVILADKSVEIVSGQGRLPTAADEICISDYTLSALTAERSTYKYYTESGEEKEAKIVSAADVLYKDDKNPGVPLEIYGKKYKVVGIYRGMDVPKNFADLKKAADENRSYTDWMTLYQWQDLRANGMYNYVVVAADTADDYLRKNGGDDPGSGDFDSSCYNINIADFYIYAIGKYDADRSVRLYDLNGVELSTLPSDGVGISLHLYAQYIYNNWGSITSGFDIPTDPDDPNYQLADEIYYELQRIVGYDDQGFADARAVVKRALDYITQNGGSVDIKLESFYHNETVPVQVAGVFYADYMDRCYLSDDLYAKYFIKQGDGGEWRTEYTTKYVPPENACIAKVFLPYDGSSSMIEKLYDRHIARNKTDDSGMMILNSLMSELEMIIMFAEELATGFLIAGLVLALFAFLLMFNFISASITAKKKEIGILRAIGARTLDVFKIFMSEAGIIAGICFILASLGTFGLCGIINSSITEGTFLNVSIMVFGPLSALCVFAVAAVTSALATLIPVALYSRKPPVDSIRAL